MESTGPELFQRFVDERSRNVAVSALTLDEHETLLTTYRDEPRLQRELLKSAIARRRHEGATGTADPAGRVDMWRERLAAMLLDDEDATPARRSREALSALFNGVAKGTPLRRETQLLAARAFAMKHRASGDALEAIAAATYYTDVWSSNPTIAHWADAAAGAELWLEAAYAEARRPRVGLPPSSIAASDARVVESRRHARDVWISLVACAELTIEASARALAGGDSGSRDVPASWAVIAARIACLSAEEWHDPGPPHERAALRDAWDAALAMLMAWIGLERWDDAERWAELVLERYDALRVIRGTDFEPKLRFSETVARVLRQQSLEPSGDLPARGVSLLAQLLRTELQGERANAAPGQREAVSASVERVIESGRRGRVGIALSGGGFRASFYHLGTLARLAEVDLLRDIEVISGVSGGAIVGACYYLKVKALLESKPDAALTKQDFITIVDELCAEFLDGVQRNIRTRIYTSLPGLAQLWLKPGYTRTDRVSELIADELFSRVTAAGVDVGVSFADVQIKAAGERPDFHPDSGNWRRASKVPIFVVNATALNSGQNWQFTPWTAGEPASADHELNSVPRLGLVAYGTTTGRANAVSFARAVAASACVPGLFPPITLDGLYEGVHTRLVDGGVFDNNGVSALLDRGCSVIVVSDGSGQLEFKPEPSMWPLSVLGRANAIGMERSRQLQFAALNAREQAGALRGMAVTHLTRGLEPSPVEPTGGQGPVAGLLFWVRHRRVIDTAVAALQRRPYIALTEYKIPEKIQERLARIRTDLDSFHDVEAYSLFMSGYMIAAGELSKSPGLAKRRGGDMHSWHMAHAWLWMDDKDDIYWWAERLLAVSRARAFKIARLYRGTACVLGGAAALIASAAVWAVASSAYLPGLRIATVAVALTLGAAAIEAALRAITWVDVRKSPPTRKLVFRGVVFFNRFAQLARGWVLPFFYVVSQIHVTLVDPRYLSAGAFREKDGKYVRERGPHARRR